MNEMDKHHEIDHILRYEWTWKIQNEIYNHFEIEYLLRQECQVFDEIYFILVWFLSYLFIVSISVWKLTTCPARDKLQPVLLEFFSM